MEGYIVREASAGDMKPIRSLIALYPDKLVQHHLPRLREFFVVEHAETRKIVGCCALQVYSKRIAEIRSLSIHFSHQGKGLAYLLVRECIRKAKRKRILELLAITSEQTARLFISQGFGTFRLERIALAKWLGKTK